MRHAGTGGQGQEGLRCALLEVGRPAGWLLLADCWLLAVALHLASSSRLKRYAAALAHQQLAHSSCTPHPALPASPAPASSPTASLTTSRCTAHAPCSRASSGPRQSGAPRSCPAVAGCCVWCIGSGTQLMAALEVLLRAARPCWPLLPSHLVPAAPAAGSMWATTPWGASGPRRWCG